MASFIPRYQKKHLQLMEREGQLMNLLQVGGKSEAIMDAIEEVRCARIRAIKETMARLSPSEVNASKFDELRNEIDELQTVEAEKILDDYRQKLAQLKGRVKIFRPPRRGGW